MALQLPSLVLAALVTAAGDDVLLYRGEFVFVIPQPIGRRMTEIARRESWMFVPELSRRIDDDEDGEDDYVAIALGTQTGYGAQIRYRLRRGERGEERLGSWYWGAIVDAEGRTVFERFNP